MNKENFKFLFLSLLATAAVFFPSLPAQAEEATTSTEAATSIQLRIEGPTNTFLNTTVSVSETCSVTDTTTTTPRDFSGYKAICTLQTAQENGLLTYQVTDWGWGYSLDKINETANAIDWSQTWIIRINNAAAQTGIDGIVLNLDDNLLITYGPWPMEPLQIISSTSTLEVNAQLDLQTQAWDDTANNFIDFTATSTFWIDDKNYESSSGTLSWTADVEGSKQIRVEAEGKTRSASQTIIVLPAQAEETTSTPGLTINLFLRYQDTFIFSSSVTSTATSTLPDTQGISHTVSASSSPLTVLVEADALSDNFSISQLDYYDSYQSFYLNCIAITAPTSTTACGNWNYTVNGLYPSIGMDSYALQDNDTVYIYFGDSWKITASTSTFPINTTTTLSTWRYNYDNLDDEWALDPNDTVDISIPNPNPTGWWDATITTSTLATNASGTVDYAFSTTGTYFAKITSDDYSKWSWPITLTVLPAPETPTSTATSTPETDANTSGTGGGGGGSSTPTPTVSSTVIAEKIQLILNFLKTQQSADGKIIDGGTTDWAIMSFGVNNQYADEIATSSKSLLDFAKEYNFTDASDLNVCASYPRHVLALLAGGVPASDITAQNLIAKIKNEECYKNNQFGQNGINDDVFALFALLATDTPTSEPIVSDILATIIADQTADGAFTWVGWPSADVTGAAVNALQYAKNKGASIDQNIFTKAMTYLKSQQLTDGGWGFGTSDVLTTSWAMMGINALNEGQTDWTNNQNKNPWSVLTEQLKTDGFYESAWAPGTVDWFGTKHAVPALLGKSWPIILASKPQPVAAPASSGGGGGGGVGGTVYLPPTAENTTSTASSILPVATISTPAIASLTLPVITEIPPATISSTGEVVKNVLLPVSNFGTIKTLKQISAPQPQPAPTEISEVSTAPLSNIAANPPTPPSPLAPLEKKVATTTATSSAILFAGTTLLLFGRLLLTII